MHGAAKVQATLGVGLRHHQEPPWTTLCGCARGGGVTALSAKDNSSRFKSPSGRRQQVCMTKCTWEGRHSGLVGNGGHVMTFTAARACASRRACSRRVMSSSAAAAAAWRARASAPRASTAARAPRSSRSARSLRRCSLPPHQRLSCWLGSQFAFPPARAALPPRQAGLRRMGVIWFDKDGAPGTAA